VTATYTFGVVTHKVLVAETEGRRRGRDTSVDRRRIILKSVVNKNM
jgi:hypothetical protein